MEYYIPRRGFRLETIFDHSYLIAAGSRRKSYPAVTPVNTTGARIWTALSCGRSIEDAAEEISLHYGIDRDQVLRDVRSFCRDLADKGYLARQEDGHAG